MLTYVENGTEFTREFGAFNESFYNSLDSALNEMAQQPMGGGREFYHKFRERVQRLATRADAVPIAAANWPSACADGDG
jgi:hypothetical protein